MPEPDRPAARGVLIAACVSALVVNANTSAVTILLPAISKDVDAPVDQLQWAVTGYSLVGAAVIVTAGALGDIFGRRKVFLGGLALFIASCALIALSTSSAGVIGGRMIQGASGATILACGMSLLSVAASGAGQLKAITLWGAASAAGGALGPLLGGVLVDTTGWQGLFWIDAAIAAACIPLTLRSVAESRDPDKPRSIDYAGTVLVALTLGPVILALSEGSDWGWTSAATLGCLAVALAAGHRLRLGRAAGRGAARRPQPAPQPGARRRHAGDPHRRGHDQRADVRAEPVLPEPRGARAERLRGGLATLPAAAAMIAITPAIAPLAAKLGGARAVVIGFGLATVGFAALTFVQASWEYWVFLAPLVGLSIGLGLANGPASSGSTSSVSADEVGQASGISNMSRYVGAAVAVAAVATINSAVAENHQAAGDSASEALAAGLAGSALLMAIVSAAGVLLVGLMRRQNIARSRPVDRAAAAAITTHTIPDPTRCLMRERSHRAG